MSTMTLTKFGIPTPPAGELDAANAEIVAATTSTVTRILEMHEDAKRTVERDGDLTSRGRAGRIEAIDAVARKKIDAIFAEASAPILAEIKDAEKLVPAKVPPPPVDAHEPIGTATILTGPEMMLVRENRASRSEAMLREVRTHVTRADKTKRAEMLLSAAARADARAELLLAALHSSPVALVDDQQLAEATRSFWRIRRPEAFAKLDAAESARTWLQTIRTAGLRAVDSGAPVARSGAVADVGAKFAMT